MKNKHLIFFLSLFLLFIGHTGCENEINDLEKAGPPYDPSIAVTVDKITPDSGGAATQLMIYGANFGSDTSLIHLTVGDKRAAVVGCNGKVIYALVPPKVHTDTGFYDVMLRIGEQEVSLGKFHYSPRWMVSTVLGDYVPKPDDERAGAVIDGTFEEARFNEPYWLTFDERKNLYLIEENNGMRYINFETKMVETKFRTGNGMSRPRTIAFTKDYDTMFVVNDAGQWTDMGHAMLTRADGDGDFKRWTSVHNSKQCNGSAFHPVHWDYYYNSYEKSQVFKVIRRDTSPWVVTKDGDIPPFGGDVNWEFNIQFAPSGDFAYYVSINQHYVGKAMYNWNTRKLEGPVVLAGTQQNAGYADGSGSSARFRNPHQGAFDEDNNFYLCDALNQCIRKITPDGIVTTFAGRPESYGLVDGPARIAQFDRPWGIVYDKDEQIFYVADQKNRRIRKIAFE